MDKIRKPGLLLTIQRFNQMSHEDLEITGELTH